jgi:hypothetical protein
MSMRGIDDAITGHDGLDYWPKERPPDVDYACCPACRERAHQQCSGVRWHPRIEGHRGNGCDCDCRRAKERLSNGRNITHHTGAF